MEQCARELLVLAGIFTYCIIVLRTIRGGDEGVFVPSLSVAFSVVLAIGGVGTLIFFIHHIASSIQASSIIASVTKETLAAVDRLFPEKPGSPPRDDEADPSRLSLTKRNWQAVMSKRDGYIQTINDEALMNLAEKHKTIVRMERRIGEFVVRNTPLASLALESPPGEEMIDALQAAYRIDRNRTVLQDCAFGIRQLVDMAMHALSPGINDTTTAVTCVDYLSAILARLAPREIPSSHRHQDGQLRVIFIGESFADLVGESFDQIRGSAAGNVAIMLRMLGSLQTIASLTHRASRRHILRQQVEAIAELAARSIEAPTDSARLEHSLARVREDFETKPPESFASKPSNRAQKSMYSRQFRFLSLESQLNSTRGFPVRDRE